MVGKIIIDGIDVSECNFRLERDNRQKCECCHATGFGVICDCEKWHDCYYKQLKRKEQECEEWKHQAELGSETVDRLIKELEEKEQECEALKQSENEAVEIIAELKHDYAELEKRHNDSFEQFKNLKMICDDYKIANAELDKENKELLKFKEMQEKELLDLRVTLGEIKKENEELKETIRAYQEDRFCQGGCAIYQYDKIHELTQALDEIKRLISEALDPEKTETEQSFDNFYKCLDIINKQRSNNENKD